MELALYPCRQNTSFHSLFLLAISSFFFFLSYFSFFIVHNGKAVLSVCELEKPHEFVEIEVVCTGFSLRLSISQAEG
jgi:hypothetical protein